jgi:hypothetical protein
MQVRVQIDRRSSPVLRHHGPRLDFAQPHLPSPISLPPKHLLDEQPRHCTERIGAGGEKKAETERHAQHELSHGYVGDDMVHNVGGTRVHATRAAARADRTPLLAAESDESRPTARGAFCDGETSGQDPTIKEGSERSLDIPWQSPVVLLSCLAEEGLQVFGNDLVQESLLGLVALATALRGCGQGEPSRSNLLCRIAGGRGVHCVDAEGPAPCQPARM